MSWGMSMQSWPFLLAGLVAIVYAMFLIHKRVVIGVGHAVLFVAGICLLLLPYLTLKVSGDGSVEITGFGVLSAATQEAVGGVAALQDRLDALADATEKRLAALESNGSSSEPQGATGSAPNLPTLANPPDIAVPAINNSTAIIEDLKRWENLNLPESSRLPRY